MPSTSSCQGGETPSLLSPKDGPAPTLDSLGVQETARKVKEVAINGF